MKRDLFGRRKSVTILNPVVENEKENEKEIRKRLEELSRYIPWIKR
jgi:hypothetical protein